MAWQLDNQSLIDPASVLAYCQASTPPHPTELFLRKANFFRIPTGMSKPGTGAVLMRREDLNAVTKTGAIQLVIDSGRGPITLKKIDVTGWENIIPGATDDLGTVVIVRLADRRGQFRTFTNAAYNVRDSDASGWITATLNSGTPWTWQLLFAELWNAVGGLGTAPSLPFTPDGTPENFAYWQTPSAVALDDFLNRIGCTVVYRPDLDTFTVVRLGLFAGPRPREVAEVALENLKDWQSEETAVGRIVKPEKIRVLFRKSSSVVTSAGVDPFYATDTTVSPAPDGVVAGSLVTLLDDMIGTASNAAARATRAAERVADWLRIADYHNPPYLYRYAGFNVEGFNFLGVQGREICFADVGLGDVTEVRSGTFPPWAWPFPLPGNGGGGSSVPCADSVCEGDWLCFEPVTDVEPNCVSGTISLTVTKLVGKCFWVKDDASPPTADFDTDFDSDFG